MNQRYTVSLAKIIKDNTFEELFLPKDTNDIYINTPDVNRPGLLLSGYDGYFDADRIQFVGLAEMEYLNVLDDKKRMESIERLMSSKPPVVIITRGLGYHDEFMEAAHKYEVPVLRTSETTSSCMAAVIAYLNVELAQRETRHGVLVEVSGEGVLILGDSGVGKSETAVELIKRGHRLIADDAVEIRKVSARSLVGAAPDNIRHFIELRGIGIINARRIFGMGAVKMTEKIDIVIQIEPWDNEKVYDRMGIDEEFINILGISVPLTIVPVKPGRNLAIIIEAAAMNNRQKKMGYNAANELLYQLGMSETQPTKEEREVWHNF